ncbi:MAG TPA: TIGR01777 family oxidoreductase [Solirubrobacteraceae bacterium]
MTVTGATGLIGPALVAHLRARDAQVTVLSRDPERALAKLSDTAPARREGQPTPPPLQAVAWDPLAEPAPIEALRGRDGVVHLAGEPIAQRWSTRAKRAIRESRVTGTRNLIAGLRALDGAAEGAPPGSRPSVLVSGSAIGYYGHHDEEPLDEEAPAGSDFLAQVCVAWESEAQSATELDMRVVQIRTGVVLDPHGGALAKMLPPFRLGIGGPVAGGKQFISWIHRDDLVGVVGAALRSDWWQGPINATAPMPVSNGEFAKALGRTLRRPAFLPVPAFALHALYGEMAEIVTRGARVLPAKPLMLGYRFRHPDLDEALRATLG